MYPNPNNCGENGVTLLDAATNSVVDSGIEVCLGSGPISYDPIAKEFQVNTFYVRISPDGKSADLQDICEAVYDQFKTLDPSQFTEYCRDIISSGGNSNGVQEFLQFMVTPAGDVSVQLPDGTSELVPLEEFISNTIIQLEKILATQEANQQLVMVIVGALVTLGAAGIIEYKYHLVTKAGGLLGRAVGALRSIKW